MNKPCLTCTRVSDPGLCENKACKPWQRWFCESWDRLRREPRLCREAPAQREGVVIGGQQYALPHRVHRYLEQDPCQDCLCPRDLCAIPCRVKRDWLALQEGL